MYYLVLFFQNLYGLVLNNVTLDIEKSNTRLYLPQFTIPNAMYCQKPNTHTHTQTPSSGYLFPEQFPVPNYFFFLSYAQLLNSNPQSTRRGRRSIAAGAYTASGSDYGRLLLQPVYTGSFHYMGAIVSDVNVRGMVHTHTHTQTFCVCTRSVMTGN